MSARIPPALARRIDRLARGAHAFHRFAHHPLCAEYAGELVSLGRRARLCRGCLHASSGALSGAALGLAMATPPARLQLALALTLAVATISWSARRASAKKDPQRDSSPPPHRVPPREGKFASRFLPLACAAFLVAGGLRSAEISGLAAALLALASLGLALTVYRKTGPRRVPCTTCPERSGPAPCRGYRAIWRRERAFTRRAQQLLSRRALP